MPLIDDLRRLLGEDAVLVGAEATAGHVEDWRGRYRGQALCVALPSTTAQVAAIVRAAVAVGVPVLAQGGNTSMSGGAVPRAEGPPPVIVNLARMRRVRAIDAANHSMVAEAGCVLAAVQAAAAEAGCLYPVSLGAEGSCQIGGNIATNAGGTGVLRWGNTRDNVLGLEVVLPDGEVWDGLRALRKDNRGFDLKHLFIGAEGTLGIVTAATLKLHPLPTAQAVAWLAVPSPAHALQLLGLLRQRCGAQLSACELMNAPQLQLVLDHVPGRRAPLPPSHEWHLLVELSDTGDEAALNAALQGALEAGAAQGLVDEAVLAASGAQREAFWLVRHSVSEGNKKGGVGLSADTAVPVSAVPAYLERASRDVRAVAPTARIVVVGHLGDGNMHFIPFFDFAAWNALPDRDATVQRIRDATYEAADAFGGTFSAEHGVGQVLRGEMARFKSPVELSMMRTVKCAFDPANLFNPHRMLPD